MQLPLPAEGVGPESVWDAPSATCADSGAQLLRCASVPQHLGRPAGTADLLPRQGSRLRL